MTFCTHCGQAVVRKWLAEEARERDVCSGCHAVHYDNPKILVWCFAHWQHCIILCRRAQEPARGFWNPPSGFVEAGESLEEAMSRELREEAGIEVLPSRLVLYRVSSIPHMNQVYVGFRTELAAPPILTAGPEVSEIGLYGEADAPLGQLAFSEMLVNKPHDFFGYLRTGDFPIFSETLRPVAKI